VVEREAAGCIPWPVKVTSCGLSGALSVTRRPAENVPRLEGVKLTFIVQLAPPASVAGESGQLFVWANCQFVVLMFEIVKATELVSVSVTLCAVAVLPTSCWPKSSFAGVRVASGATAVPERAMAWGLPAASSVMVSVPASVPADMGANVTLIVQLAPALTEVPQSFVWEKSPVVVMPSMPNAPLPVFVKVTT